MQTYFHRGSTTLSMYPYSYHYSTSYDSRFVHFSTRRNKSLHTQGHLSFAGKKGSLYCRHFSSISLSVCLKVTVWNIVDVLAQSSISHSYCGQFLPSCNKVIAILLAFIFILLFSRAVAIAVLPLLLIAFATWVAMPLLSAIFNSSHHFYYHAIFIAAVRFIAVQPAIIASFHPRLDLFMLWFCHRRIHFAAKDVYVVTTGRCPVFC